MAGPAGRAATEGTVLALVAWAATVPAPIGSVTAGPAAPAGPADSVHMPVPAGMAGRCTAMTGPEGLAEPALAVPAATVGTAARLAGWAATVATPIGSVTAAAEPAGSAYRQRPAVSAGEAVDYSARPAPRADVR